MNDLISRQALREAMYHEAFETDTDMQRWDSGCWIRYKMFENALSSAPTIDAVPVKHGVWKKVKYEDDDGYFYLYVHKDCGCEQARERNYCPNCGARMDGRKDDETD